jgi:hypothetical protein
VLAELRKRVEQIPEMRRPFRKLPSNFTISRSHWIEPRLVAEVRIVRHPTFLGLREDKSAREVVRDPPPGGIRATLAQLSQVARLSSVLLAFWEKNTSQIKARRSRSACSEDQVPFRDLESA